MDVDIFMEQESFGKEGTTKVAHDTLSKALLLTQPRYQALPASLPLPRGNVTIAKRDALIVPVWVMHLLLDQSEGPPMSGFGGHF